MRLLRFLTAAGLGGVALIPATAGASLRAQQPIDIAGEVDGLFPGSTVTLPVTVTNPEPFTIKMTSVDATVGDASSACPAAYLTVDSSTPNVDIAPGATATIALIVHMDRAAPDDCQNATFPLQFVGTATEADVSAARPTPPAVTPATPASAPTTPPSLALTGTNLVLIVGIALALIGLGAAIRRRAFPSTEPNRS